MSKYTNENNINSIKNGQKYNNILKEKFPKWFKDFTGHSFNNFTSINRFAVWLHRPIDATSLGLFRMLFGILMLIDIPEERGGGHLDVRYGEPKDCHFPLFNSMHPLSLPLMGIVYFIMWIGALGIALGYKFKSSCLLFLIPYWFIFLLDKPAWNNHSYLYGLCGFLFLWTDANQFCSIDLKQLTGDKRKKKLIPYWNYFLIKFQFFILYFIAGLKKLTVEWLSGYSMTNLGYHWIFIPFRIILSVEMIELLIIHWFAAIFDVTISFFMTWKRTRIWVTPFMISFHLMNSRLFTIGMFPWVCLAELPLFYNFNWLNNYQKKISKKEKCEHINVEHQENKILDLIKDDQCLRPRKTTNIKSETEKIVKFSEKKSSITLQPTLQQLIRTFFILFYCIIQLFLPYSHFITKGYNNWTNGLYGYSWDMMVYSYDTILTSIKIIDNNNDKIHYLDPYAFSHYDRWTKHADMAKQYAKCIERNLINDFEKNRQTILTSKNLSIYFDVWCSMNRRFQQRVFNPNENILNANWSPFEKTKWILPILNELNYMRPKLNSITNDVLLWSNHSDVLFIADFPGLTLENFISPDLDNVTLTVLDGAVKVIKPKNNTIEAISAGQSIKIQPNDIHSVTTISQIPSCYMYTYINKTMKDLKITINNLENDENNKWLPIWDEFLDRAVNYRDFFYHIGNSLMFLIYGVPMPVRLRDRD